jgi:parallel beta-helix repeat protein
VVSTNIQDKKQNREETNMSPKITSRIMVVALAAFVGLKGQSLLASTNVAVGPSTCQPGLVHFATIQAAVSAVPFGSTVLVCPGTYPEQVAITQPLNLKGVTDGTGNAAVITVPGGGLVLNANAPTAFGLVSAQIVIQNTVGVNVSNLTVDGTGSNCVPGAIREAGIVIFNVGTANDGTSAAKIQNVVVRNEIACGGLGEGIVSDTAFATISTNQVHNIDRSGIVVAGGKTNVASNNIQSAGLNGVAMDGANQTAITGNTIANVNQAGMLVQLGTNGATIARNTILSSPSAIGIWYFDVFNSPITGNKISDTTWGVVLQFCFNDVVQTNTFSQSAADGILDQNSFGGNIVTKNTVNEAAFGIFTDSTVGGDTLVPNTLYNVVVTVDPNPTTIGTPDM